MSNLSLQKRILRAGVAALLALLLSFTPAFFSEGGSTASAASNKYIPNQVVFTLKNKADLSSVITQYGLAKVKRLNKDLYYSATIPSGQDAAVYATLMRSNLVFAVVEPNYKVNLVGNASYFGYDATYFGFDSTYFGYDSTSVISGTMTSTPTAIQNAQNQWAWQKINLGAAQVKGYNGAGVKVAVLDTGVNYNHPELVGHVVPGFDALGTNLDGQDVQGHGTFVAGVIEQLVPAATIIPVRVLDASGQGTLDSVINGLNWAASQGAKVINMSFSTTTYLGTLDTLIQSLAAQNIVLAAAAGNDGNTITTYPAALNNVLALSATDSQDNRASFSTYGSFVTLGAPGVQIYSMGWKGGYGTSDGTSFSTPIVSAAAAINLSLHPLNSSLQVSNALLAAVTSYPLNCICTGMGRGRISFDLLN